jgi:hypothetical protein
MKFWTSSLITLLVRLGVVCYTSIKVLLNRIQKTNSYYSYTPITADLSQLLVEFVVNDMDGYIVVPEQRGRASLKNFISKAFTHFWRLTGLKRKVTFKNLRKRI